MCFTGTINSPEEYETEVADFFAALGRKIDSAVENYEAELAGFFADLGQKINGAVTDHEVELTNFFAGLGPMVNIAKRAQAELDRTAATKFSVFEYFKVPEETLSDIFADLLDPDGTHGQGDRFLRLFLDKIPSLRGDPSRKLGCDFSPSDRRDCKIRREYSTEERRRIDIVLKMPHGRRIGIENKPSSGDLKNQIADYLKELKRRDKEARVLYLSGNGKDPEAFSLPTDPNDRARCVTVPYRGGESPSVENWIRQCWKECEAERVRWFLKDLLEYIQRSFRPLETPDNEEEL